MVCSRAQTTLFSGRVTRVPLGSKRPFFMQNVIYRFMGVAEPDFSANEASNEN